MLFGALYFVNGFFEKFHGGLVVALSRFHNEGFVYFVNADYRADYSADCRDNGARNIAFEHFILRRLVFLLAARVENHENHDKNNQYAEHNPNAPIV